jgi:hypothetical protein
MAGRVPAIHVLLVSKTWIPGMKPGMTKRDFAVGGEGGRQPSKSCTTAL